MRNVLHDYFPKYAINENMFTGMLQHSNMIGSTLHIGPTRLITFSTQLLLLFINNTGTSAY